MKNKQPQMVPVQYIPMNNCPEEDEIDLRKLFKTI